MEPAQQSETKTQTKRIIMLPSKHIPESLTSQIADLKDFSIRFINGYRNILQSSQGHPQWALTPNEDYCGQAYCYLLKSSVNKQELSKKEVSKNHVIHEVSQEMFVVQSASGFTPNELTLTAEQLDKLIEEVSESKQSKKLAINLIKNAFESFESYTKAVSQLVEKFEQKLEQQVEEKIPTVGESLSLEAQTKKLQGEMIATVPKCNKETGEWDEGETLDIKLSSE